MKFVWGGEINKKREMGGMGNINTKDKTGEGRMGRRDEKKKYARE